MRLAKFFVAALIGGALSAPPALSKVYVRVSQGELPAAKILGVNDLVIAWPGGDVGLMSRAKALGYNVFLETAPGDLSQAADAAEKANGSGVIVDAAEPGSSDGQEALRRVEEAHSKLTFLILNSGGKQPQIKGRLVVDRNGVLQVSSPTAQPWVDSNLALVKFVENVGGGTTPVYSFHWDLSDALHKDLGPSAEDYALAIAEANAFHADVIVDLHEGLQKGLTNNDANSLELWNRVKRYIAFPTQAVENERGMRTLANVGVVAGEYRSSYEGINLMARHNIPFVLLHSADLEAKRLNDLNTLVVFSVFGEASKLAINEFAKRGGIVVMVNVHADFPWHASKPVRKDEHAATYTVGTGQIVELLEPVTDPEAFARDVQRLMGAQKSLFGLWNSLTTVAVGFVDPRGGETILNVVNYAASPESVQVHVKGHFSSVRYESPEQGCCQPLVPVERDGFTEFVIPQLVISGRVHLKP
jgi:hypothetical protein